jgi:hypothetical protein
MVFFLSRCVHALLLSDPEPTIGSLAGQARIKRGAILLPNLIGVPIGKYRTPARRSGVQHEFS